MDTESENKLLETYSAMFAGSPNTVVFLDRVMKCVSTNNSAVFPVGESLLTYVKEPLIYPFREYTEVRIFLGDEFYCARLTPLKNSYSDTWLYMAEIVSSDKVLDIAAKTDAASKIFPLCNSLEYNMASIWKNAIALERALLSEGDYEKLEQVFALEKSLAGIGSVTKNVFEYADMLFSKRDDVRIDAGTLLGKIVERCNGALAKCGRHLEYVCEPALPEICADSRHAVTAFINAIQNALLYSPQDSVPIVAVYGIKDGTRSGVQVRFTNENIMFTKKDFKNEVDVNFNYQRRGYGIPIIKRFAEMSAGSFDMSDENGRVVVTLTFPAAASVSGAEVRLEAPAFSFYDTGIPDITELKMREVVDFFGKV